MIVLSGEILFAMPQMSLDFSVFTVSKQGICALAHAFPESAWSNERATSVLRFSPRPSTEFPKYRASEGRGREIPPAVFFLSARVASPGHLWPFDFLSPRSSMTFSGSYALPNSYEPRPFKTKAEFPNKIGAVRS